MKHAKIRSGLRLLLCPLVLMLAACEAELDADLAADGDLADAASVVLSISGVQVLDDSGELYDLTSSADEEIDLLDYLDGGSLELVSGGNLPEGHYTGIRLTFNDSGSYIEQSDGGQVPIDVEQASSFADLDLEMSEDSSEKLLLALDLHFSLSDRISTTGTYLLNPQLRAMIADQTSSISGSVEDALVESTDCRQGRTLTRGVMVYAYEGANVTPGDFYLGNFGPLVSAPVIEDADASGYSYNLPYLPAGTYTLALTCDADSDDPLTRETLEYPIVTSVSIDADEAETVNLSE